MTKRKADASEEPDCPHIVKALRRSISGFLTQNESNNVTNDNNGLELFDYKGHSWTKYRQRLASFDIKTRVLKPKEVSPVECARHGWKNIDDDGFLQCDDCAQVLCVKMPSDEVSNRVFNQCLWNIQRKLIKAHTVICPWRTNGGLNTSNPYDIVARYKLLLESDQMEVPLDESIVPEEIIARFDFKSRFFLEMAIFGWLPVERSSDNFANFACHLCGRMLTTSVFSAQAPMNPLKQHHSYCPVADKVFPLWRESLENVHILKKKESLIPTMWNVKNMLKGIFDSSYHAPEQYGVEDEEVTLGEQFCQEQEDGKHEERKS